MGAAGSCSRKSGSGDVLLDPKLNGIHIGSAESFKDNEIREVKVTDTFSVLVSEFEGKFYAYGGKCPHYGASLALGAMVDGVIKCPWHGASFDIRSGDIEDYPGSGDCIPIYQVTKGNKGELTVYPSNYGNYKIQRPLQSTKDRSKVTICIGGGPTSITFAQTLRENYYDGRIIIVSREPYLPYDRTKLSKAIGSSWPDLKLKDEKWFADAQVEIMLNALCTTIDMEKKEIGILNRAERIPFTHLLIATGVRPRLPEEHPSTVKGVDSKNVLTLCTLRDAARINERAAGKNVIIQGSGFIAMELISSLSPIVSSLKVISRQKRPYGIIFGDAVGRILQHKLTSNFKNVKFYGCDSIKKILPNKNGEVERVITFKKREFPCDVVIYAIGGIPNTDILQNKQQNVTRTNKKKSSLSSKKNPLDITPTGHVTVNKYMETSIKGMWAAGDMVRFPLDIAVMGYATSGHWGMAQKMGRVAALSVLGKKRSISTSVPFFWTNVCGMSLRYTGYGEHFNQSLIFGDLESMKFCVLYKRDFKYLAVLTCNCDPIAAQMSFDLQDGIDYSDSYPPFIIEQFPDPPVTGNTNEGVKFATEETINEFDMSAHREKHTWFPRKIKVYDDDVYKDKEFLVKQIKSPNERKERIFFGRRRDQFNMYKQTNRNVEDMMGPRQKYNFY